MKPLFLLLLFLFPITVVAQSLLIYEDSVNRFEIGVPNTWRYGVPKDKSTSFRAVRRATDSTDVVREQFTVNVLYDKPADLETSYKEFMGYISKAPGFKILEEGEKEIHGRRYKWLVETHKYNPGNEDVINYVYFANSGKSLLILTMVTSMQALPKYRELFDKIAGTIKY